MITLATAKQYLRVDSNDEDALIQKFISAAVDICAEVARMEVNAVTALVDDVFDMAELYAVAQMYEFREDFDADRTKLMIRSMLQNKREVYF